MNDLSFFTDNMNKKAASKKPRKLSAFLVQEMLYSYLSSQLDPESQKAVQEFIKESPEIQKEIRKIKSSLSYCQKLSKIKIPEKLVRDLKEHPSWTKKWTKTFLRVLSILNTQKNQWIWRFSVYSSLLFFFGLLTFFFFQAQKRELFKNMNWPMMASKNNKETVSNNKEELMAESSSPPIQNASSKKRSQESVSKNLPPAIQSSSRAFNMNTQLRKNKNPQNADKKTKSVVAIQKLKDSKKNKTPTTGSLTHIPIKGFVYKAFMNLNVEKYTDMLVQKIQSMQGKKAGKVPLGWRKDKGSYFHFSLPTSNYSLLLEELRKIGYVHLKKEPHKRVMPEGKVRFILWIE